MHMQNAPTPIDYFAQKMYNILRVNISFISKEE